METIQVVPGVGIANLCTLGWRVSFVLKRLQSFSLRLPKVRIIQDQSDSKLIVQVLNIGVTLHFDSLLQSLTLIEIEPSEGMKISFGTTDPQQFSTFEELYANVNSYYQEKLIDDQHSSLETYAGISFRKDADVVSHVFLHQGHSLLCNVLQEDFPLFVIRPGTGIEVRKPESGKIVALTFDSYSVDVVKVLGQPQAVFYKPNGDYIYNYIDYGGDFVFDMETQNLKKVVLHLNSPHSIYFGEYERANFILPDVQGQAVTPLHKWPEIMEGIGQETEQYKRKYLYGFRDTKYYCYPWALWEVLETDEIATITLLKSNL